MTLNICVILADDRPAGPGERRFLAALAQDARLLVVGVFAAPTAVRPLPGALRGALKIEVRAFPAPDTAPGLTAQPGPIPPGGLPACDVIVDFAHATLDATPAHGIWRLSAFSPDAAITEARLRAAVTEVILTVDAVPAARAAYDTKFLATRNAAYAREKSVQLLHRELARLAQTGTRPARIAHPTGPVRPRNRHLPDYIGAVGRELAMRAWRKVQVKRGQRPGMFFLRLGHGTLADLDPARGTDLIPDGNTYWADPFLFEDGGETYLFYEDFDFATGRGHLSVGRIEGDAMTPLGPVMVQPHHLSYPFVFRWGDEILMIPETHQAERIEVWRATGFPLKWELASTALEGVKAVDTVVFEHEGAWWLLTNICRDSFGDFGTELHLYRIDDPMLGGATPHPLNPVVIDATSARGGGRVFEHEGRLLRASQDNSHGVYGYGLNLMEITALSDTDYAERRLRHLSPDALPGVMGLHHMDAAGGRTVIDLRRTFTGLHRSGRGKHQHAAAQEHHHQGEPDERRLGDGEAEPDLHTQ